MPGPGPHMIYALGTGLGMMAVSEGRFTPHHCLCYALNGFFGPDIGPFSEWVSSVFGFEDWDVQNYVHDPFYYVFIFGLPFSFLYLWGSRFALQKGYLDSPSGESLCWNQCLLLIFAGSLSHFFLDHLFEEEGRTRMYRWILSTGWWAGRAPINPDAVVVVGALCSCLIGGFIYINRVKPSKSIKTRQKQCLKLIVIISGLYCLWCATQIYVVQPRRPPVGEEADLGVLVFLFLYFFLPHCLCIASMDS